MDHQDLWKQLASIVQSKSPDFFGIRKVKAHVTQAQVESGVITQFEKIMNEDVDALARSAANANAVDVAIDARAYRTVWVTTCIQVMMVRILE